MSNNKTYTVAVVGSGFSGTLVAAHLLSTPTDQPLRIVLAKRSSSRFARGVAYATNCFRHLLNVPAGKMSAFVDDDEHFLRWARSRKLKVRADQFVPRHLYGEYLAQVLSEAQSKALGRRQFLQIPDEVTGLDLLPRNRGAWLKLRRGKPVRADRVVLALGNQPSTDPLAGKRLNLGERYIRDPWKEGALDSILPHESVLLVGTGLTMVDVAVQLRHSGHSGELHALSRHGLLPREHRHGQLTVSLKFVLQNQVTLHRLLRTVREVAKAAGDEWRAVLDALRPITPELWKRLSLAERRRFLRHVRCYWDVHRHRMPPEIAAQITEMIAAGQIAIHAGRLRDCRVREKRLDISFRERGAKRDSKLTVARIINCTGPDQDAVHSSDPLIINLRKGGFIRPDPLGLGLDVSDDGAIINARGEVSKTLYTIGPWLKGKLWETTAVPEIRAQAAALARTLTLRKQERARLVA
ncbi:MAG: hypothetical protein QOH71_550 [Blastocatellia bacterium]|jgi:uncharacterized NAD(P)/FAD-binding protein YdhS|nr:hypothetical protein [Blastocatellia bacterium]